MMTCGQQRHAHLKGELPLKGSLSNIKFPEQHQCFNEKGNDQEFQEEDSFQFPWHSIYDAYIEPLAHLQT